MIKSKILQKAAAVILPLTIAVAPLTISAQTEELTTPSGIAYSNIKTEIESYVKECEGGLASLEVAVFDGDETIYSGYFGHANIENDIAADEETVYEWASCSKLLVWVSVMQLYEQGLIDLEADIKNYLPDGFLTKLQYDEPITMLNLMNHNAGWQEVCYEDSVTDEADIVDLETALKMLEPYQSYKPNEHTSYSNWGTGLAAYIVEQITDTDYVEYVHENIFEPLGMEHTSVGIDFSDNAWVKKKRNELKTYSIMEGINESYGTNIHYCLYYPVGGAVGTLSDMEKFAKAFTAYDCPLFENEETRDFMLSPSSYYGDSDIAKICHGLWTSEYAVQTMGHGGNSFGCSSMIQFDPISGLGVVIMTNEAGESAFNYGIPSLLFGDYESSVRIDGTITDDSDISGVYLATRSFQNGFFKLCSYIGGLMIVCESESSDNFNIALAGMNLKRVADNQWIQDNGNGMKMFLYESNKDGKRVFEMMSTEYVIDEFYMLKAVAIIGFILLACVSIIILTIKFIAHFIRRNPLTALDKSVTLTQILSALMGIGFVIIYISALTATKAISVIFCILMAVIALLSLANAVYLLYKTIKAKDLKKRMIVKNVFYTICGIFLFAFILYFQMYNFWNC